MNARKLAVVAGVGVLAYAAYIVLVSSGGPLRRRMFPYMFPYMGGGGGGGETSGPGGGGETSGPGSTTRTTTTTTEPGWSAPFPPTFRVPFVPLPSSGSSARSGSSASDGSITGLVAKLAAPVVGLVGAIGKAISSSLNGSGDVRSPESESAYQAYRAGERDLGSSSSSSDVVDALPGEADVVSAVLGDSAETFFRAPAVESAYQLVDESTAGASVATGAATTFTPTIKWTQLGLPVLALTTTLLTTKSGSPAQAAGIASSVGSIIASASGAAAAASAGISAAVGGGMIGSAAGTLGGGIVGAWTAIPLIIGSIFGKKGPGVEVTDTAALARERAHQASGAFLRADALADRLLIPALPWEYYRSVFAEIDGGRYSNDPQSLLHVADDYNSFAIALGVVSDPSVGIRGGDGNPGARMVDANDDVLARVAQNLRSAWVRRESGGTETVLMPELRTGVALTYIPASTTSAGDPAVIETPARLVYADDPVALALLATQPKPGESDSNLNTGG
jgi:hypothetical protein